MKYTPEMNRELRRAVQNFNKKRQRLEEKGVSASLLPTKASVRGLKLAFNNKRDLNRRIRQLQSFSAAGAVRKNEGNLVGTDSLFKYTQKRINKAKTRRVKMQRSLEASPFKYKSVRDDALLNNEAKIKFLSKDVEKIDTKTMQRLNKNALDIEEAAKRKQTFYDSYFKMMYIEAGQSDYDYNKIKVIERELRKFTPDQLLELKETDVNVQTVTDQWVDSPKKVSELSPEGKATLQNKFDALYEALPQIKVRYGIK